MEKLCKNCGAKVEWSEQFHCWICVNRCGWHVVIYPEGIKAK